MGAKREFILHREAEETKRWERTKMELKEKIEKNDL